MRIAISSEGMDLASHVARRFERAPYLIIFDTDKDSFRIHSNDRTEEHSVGVEGWMADYLSRENVDIVVTGGLASEDSDRLLAQGIKTLPWSGGTVSQAIALARGGRSRTVESGDAL